MFRLCRVSNLQPLHHGANALPLSYEEQSNLCICYLSSIIPRQIVFLLIFFRFFREIFFLFDLCSICDAAALNYKIDARQACP